MERHRGIHAAGVMCCCLLAGLCLLLVWQFQTTWKLPGHVYDEQSINATSLWAGPSISSENESSLNYHRRLSTQEDHRLAILLPYIASSNQSGIPPYMELFCFGAYGSRHVADFFIFHNGVFHESSDTTSSWCHRANVYFFHLDIVDLADLIARRVLDAKVQPTAFSSWDQLIYVTAKYLQAYPYALVEFKPALGHIFRDYITGAKAPRSTYTHWGYSDLDILFGDLGRWISPDEWTQYDIVTYTFGGDQHKLYIRGQFAIHRISVRNVDQIWRTCDYLSHMDQRLSNVLSGKVKMKLESAEGCYSAAVLNRTDIAVKYAVKSWTDVDPLDTVYSHGLYVSHHAESGRVVLYKKASTSLSAVDPLQVPADWYRNDPAYSDPAMLLQQNVGERIDITDLAVPATVSCMYWVQPQYQSRLCLPESAGVGPGDTVYWIRGRLYKQSFRDVSLHQGIVTKPFFHFQEWKRYYRKEQLRGMNQLLFSTRISSFVLTKEGTIHIPASTETLEGVKTVETRSVPFSLVSHQESLTNQLPAHSYCLRAGPSETVQPRPASECFHSVSWRMTDRDRPSLRFLSSAPAWPISGADATLVLTLEILPSVASDANSLEFLLHLASMNAAHWQGNPCVLVIHVTIDESATTLETVHDQLVRRFSPSQSPWATSSLVAVLYDVIPNTDEYSPISRKALTNMAVDAVPTRWFLRGPELERGLVLSVETYSMVQQTIHSNQKLRASAFLIPQFGIDNKLLGDFNLENLKQAKIDQTIKLPSDFESACDDESSPVHLDLPILSRWWIESSSESVPEGPPPCLENDLLRLLETGGRKVLHLLDESPILLVDNESPSPGIHTVDLHREVEEFAGRRCYNGLYLAQLAAYGYTVDVLPGAFAASDSRTRLLAGISEFAPKTGLGTVRCHGCVFFDEESDGVVDEIIQDEVMRPTKTAILWDEKSIHF
jgi:hypothetical protein